MALNFQDQGTVDLGRSRLQTPDPYQPIRNVGNDGSQMEELSKALAKFGGIAKQNEEKEIEAEKRNVNVYSQMLADAIKDGPVTDQAVSDVLNKQHIVVRAAAAEDLGYRRGAAAAQEAFLQFPQTMVPEEAKKAYDGIFSKALQDSKGNISYQQGYMKAFEDHYLRRNKEDGDALRKDYKDSANETFSIRTRGVVKQHLDGITPTDSLDPEVIKTPATQRLSQLDPSKYDTPFKLASQLVGADEKADTSAISSFIKRATGKSIDPSQTPWCAAFVEGVLASKGQAGTGSWMARSYLNYGVGTDSPQQGDLVVLKRGSDPNKGHVGFFAGYDENGNVKVLGGNQGNKVSVASYSADDVLGFRKIDQGDMKSHVEDNRPQYASLNTGTATDASTGPAPAGVQVADAGTKPNTAYDGSPMTPRLLAIQRDVMKLDAVYKATRLSSNKDRRDSIGEALILEALERDDPTILRAFPKEIMSNDMLTKFISTEKTIQRNIEHKQQQAITRTEHAEKTAKAETESRITEKAAKGERIDEFKDTQYTFFDHVTGKPVTRSNHTLVAIADGLNKKDRVDSLDSKGTAATLNEKFTAGYVKNDLREAFADDPAMLALLGDRKMLTDQEARAYIANRSDLNRDEKLKLWENMDSWKNNYAVVKDQVVQDFYRHYVGNTVDKYTKADKVALKMASVDINVRNALASVEGDVRQAFEDTVLHDINGFKADNKRDPTYAEKKKILEDAAKKAREVFDDRVRIIEGIEPPPPGGNKGQQTGGQQTGQPLSVQNVDVTTNPDGHIIINRKQGTPQSTSQPAKPEGKPAAMLGAPAGGVQTMENFISGIGNLFTLNSSQRDAIPMLQQSAVKELANDPTYKQLVDKYNSTPQGQRGAVYGEISKYYGTFVENYVTEHLQGITPKSNYDPTSVRKK